MEYTGQRVLKSDIAKPLDLSSIKVELVKEDGTKIVVPYSEFGKYGIEVTNRDTGEKLYDKMNLSDETKSQALIARVTHKGSKRRTELRYSLNLTAQITSLRWNTARWRQDLGRGN